MVKRVSIHPHLEEQPTRRTDGDRNLRENIAKGNTGSIYTHLYAALFGGEPAQRYKGNHDVLPKGDLRILHPDITRQTRNGLDNIEIKACSYADNRHLVSVEQIENYFYLLSQRLLVHREKLPEVEVGMFRYGGKKPSFLFGYNTKRFVDIVSKTTDDLVVIPSNLFLFSALCSQVSSKDKSSSKSQTKCITYHRTPSWFSTTLNSSDDPIDDLAALASDDYKELFRGKGIKIPSFVTQMTPDERKILMWDYLLLDRLKFERFISQDLVEVRCRGFKFKPFDITRVYLTQKDRLAWLESFRKNHHHFLTELLGVRDLYFENYEAGDASEEGIIVSQDASDNDPEKLPF